jgi:hypothetical protein
VRSNKVYNETRLIKKVGRLGTLSEKDMKEIGEKILLLLDFEELVDLY